MSLISPEIIDGATGAPEHAMKMQKQITFMTQHTHKHTHEWLAHTSIICMWTWGEVLKMWSEAVTVSFFINQTLKEKETLVAVFIR